MPKHDEDAARDNVVSLDRLRERKQRPAQAKADGDAKAPGSAQAPPEESAEAPAGATAAAAVPIPPRGGAVRGDQAESGQTEGPPLPGKLIWLHCPACDTLEYTELALPGGRRHKCGTIVEETEVPIDVRAELTVAEVNLRRAAALETYLQQQKERFEEYRRRLTLMAGGTPQPYSLTEERVKALPAADVDPLGLIITEALHHPEKRFKKKD